uniref:Uncharacterized protein n=1 Tax=Arundo donax TaxID=35708 RepID=A0A0A9APJ4_ARUDO
MSHASQRNAVRGRPKLPCHLYILLFFLDLLTLSTSTAQLGGAPCHHLKVDEVRDAP